MDLQALFDLSLATQVALGSGYLSYVVAYSGWRESHTPVDATFITLAYASISSLALWSLSDFSPWTAALAGFVAPVASSVVWRKWLRSACLRFLSVAGVHRDDGLRDAWTSIVQTDRVVDQISVHTKDGRILYLNNRPAFANSPWAGLNLGGDGSIAMAVEEEEMPDGSTEIREGIVYENWGTRITFIPADQVARVNIRLK
jgi:hypothetical protein